jgi:hypothetical protein
MTGYNFTRALGNETYDPLYKDETMSSRIDTLKHLIRYYGPVGIMVDASSVEF